MSTTDRLKKVGGILLAVILALVIIVGLLRLYNNLSLDDENSFGERGGSLEHFAENQVRGARKFVVYKDDESLAFRNSVGYSMCIQIIEGEEPKTLTKATINSPWKTMHPENPSRT